MATAGIAAGRLPALLWEFLRLAIGRRAVNAVEEEKP
jgi:hypothetical protein